MQMRAMQRFLLTTVALVSGMLPVTASTRDYLKQPVGWFRSSEGKQRLGNLLTYQDPSGCWPKNMDTTVEPYQGDRRKLKGTFDNSATVNELRLLGRAYNVTKQDPYREAFNKGIQCILDAQYSNGGWPQNPKASEYHQHITFNDGTMIGLMNLLREVFEDEQYRFVDAKMRQHANHAFQRGVECILACQIRVKGTRTAWCAQHDRETLEPRRARSYEHPSISGHESAGITLLLMSIQEPSTSVRESVRAAVVWYEQSRLDGIRLERKNGDKRIVQLPDSPPLWARFYEIGTNRPIFSGRDGVIQYDIAAIESERRNGYSWYVNTGARVLENWERWMWK